MTDDELRRLFGLLTGRERDGWAPRNYLLSVQDGEGVGRLLGAKDWVNYLDEDSFVRLARLAQSLG